MEFPELVRKDGELLALELSDPWSFRELSDEERRKLSEYSVLVDALPLPTTQLANCDRSGSELLEMLEEFLLAKIQMAPSEYTATAAFIVSTFFADVLPVIPTAALITRFPEQAITSFIAIASACRNPIIIDASVPLERLPLYLNPTLALDATTLTGSRMDRLCPPNSRLIKRLVGSRVEGTSTPRLILSREPVRGASLNVAFKPAVVQRSISIAPTLLEGLAGYRLRQRATIAQRVAGVSSLSGILCACFPDDESAHKKLSVAINAVDSNGKILAVDDTSEENFLTQALHAAVHKDTRIKILAVAQLTTGLFEREGLRWEVSPRFVAAFLRRNGFKLRHARVGLVIEVDERSSSLAHRLYQETFGADGVRFTGCALCEEDTSKLQGQ